VVGRWQRWVAMAAVAALAVAACASGDDGGGGGGGAEGPTGEPQVGGTLRYGVEAETSGLNPTTDRFAISAFMMGNAVFDRLAHVDENGEVQPWLAESWEPAPDYMSWTLTLRPDIQFHDGTPLNSEALQVNFDLAIADPLIGIAFRPVFRDDNPFEIIDDLTVRFHMREPNAHFADYLVAQTAFIASPTWLQAAAENPDLNQEPVGTGPFVFESRTQDQSTRFVRNDDWWGGEVYLDAVEFVVQTDPARRADQLIAGDLDMMHTSDPQTIELLRSEGDLQLFDEELGEEGFVMMNTQSAPFDDIRVRQALTYATPKEQYLDVITRGLVTPADSMFHPDLPEHNPDVTQEADNPERAAELAAEYCAEVPANCEGDKIKMSFKYTGPSVIQDLIADTLIGGWESAFVVERDQVLQDDYITQVALGDYQVVTWRQYGSADPDLDVLWHDCRSVGDPGALSLNWTRHCNEDTQALMLEQRASDDRDAQSATWQQIAQNINGDYLYIFLNHTLWMVAARDNVGDVMTAEFPDGGTVAFRNGFHVATQIWLAQ
jgi:peptide/nickel transport system substrate-binding protein